MALERKPVEEAQEPGYPSTDEYVTGRRAFIGLLGLTAVGVGGVYLLKDSEKEVAKPTPIKTGGMPMDPINPRGTQGRTGGVPQVPPKVPSGPQGRTGGVAAEPQARPTGAEAPVVPPPTVNQGTTKPVEPAQPKADIEGDVIRPKPPEAKPVVPPPGVPPPPKNVSQNAPAPDAPKQPAQPVVPALGVTAPVPARPQAVIRGEAVAVEPKAQTAGKPASLVQP